MVSRDYAWIDESVERSDEDCARAAALAKKWSTLKTEEENEIFARQARDEYDYDPFEDCECAQCLEDNYQACESRAAYTKEQAKKQAERDLEIELVEDKLSRLGARMMRPYEHWNEDERYMEYMENREY